MFNKKIFLFVFLFVFSSIFGVFALQEEGQKKIDGILSEIRKEQNLQDADIINPEKVSPKLLDELGIALMDGMMANRDRRELMDQMMGGEGSDSLTAMRQRIAYNYLTGNISGYGNMMGNNDMMYGNNGMMNNNMMGNNNSPMNNSRFKGSPGYNFMMNRMNIRFLKGSVYLNLTKELNEKIQEININLEKEVSPLRIKILEKQKILLSLWSANKTDEKAIIKTDKEAFDLFSEINGKAVAAHIKIAELLTPEQRNKLPKMGFMGGFPMMNQR